MECKVGHQDLMDGSLILGIDFNPTGFFKLLNLNDPQAAEEQDCHNKLRAVNVQRRPHALLPW